MLSNEGVSNLKLLKDMLLRTWRNNVTILSETETQIPVDAFELLIVFYGHHKVLLEYEMGMFAFKIWTGKKFEYLDKFTNEKIVYGFDSMFPQNIQHNFEVLDEVLNKANLIE